MSVSAKVGTFNIPATDTNAIQVTVGFQPKAMIFFWSGRTESVDTNGSADHDLGMGFSDGTNHVCQRTHSDDNVGTTQADHSLVTTDCIALLTHAVTSASDGTVRVTATDSTSFTITPQGAGLGHALRVSYIALGGSDITNVLVGTFVHGTTPAATFDITSVGFQPDCALFLNPFATGTGITADGSLSVGAATAAASQFVAEAGSDDGVTTSQTARYFFTGDCLSQFGTGLVSQSNRAEFVQFLSNGMQFLKNEGTTAVIVGYLAIKGGSYKVGTFNTVTDTSDISVTGPGFKPAAVLAISHNTTEQAEDTVVAQASMSIGAFTGPTEEVAHAMRDDDAIVLGATTVWTAVEYDESYINLDSSGAVQGAGHCKSMDATGFTFSLDGNPDPSASIVGYVAFGPAETGSPPSVPLVGSGVQMIRRRAA